MWIPEGNEVISLAKNVTVTVMLMFTSAACINWHFMSLLLIYWWKSQSAREPLRYSEIFAWLINSLSLIFFFSRNYFATHHCSDYLKARLDLYRDGKKGSSFPEVLAQSKMRTIAIRRLQRSWLQSYPVSEYTPAQDILQRRNWTKHASIKATTQVLS